MVDGGLAVDANVTMNASPLYITHSFGNYRFALQPEGPISLPGWVILTEHEAGRFKPIRKFTEIEQAAQAWNDACAGASEEQLEKKVYA
jgi:hypothetical protein